MALSPAESQNPHYFYVAPEGNDTWSGTLEAPNTDQSDGPFATPHRALEAVRELAGNMPITVVLRGGTYHLDSSLVLTPEHSGSEDAPLRFIAHEGEKPTLSAGQQITGWQPTTVGNREAWVAEVPEVREGGWFFRQLWVDGERRQRARHPNSGYLEIAESPDAVEGTPWHDGQTRFRFHEGDIQAWEGIEGAELTAMCRWTESHLPITSVDVSDRMVSFGKRTVFQVGPGDLYYIENVLAFLDQPGEWYLDGQAGRIYYLPIDGESADDVTIIAPKLAQVLRLEGQPESGQYVEHITFEGIGLSHTEWWLGDEKAGWPKPDIAGFVQAAIGVPGAVYGEGARHCTFDNCAINHIGTYAVELGRGCVANTITHCDLSDLGAGGVKIGETTIRENSGEQTHGNEISHCTIRDGGILFHSAIGIWVGQSFENRFTHNEIADFYYSGFSIGWTWGYGNSIAHGNLVEFNHVHHLGAKSNGDGPILSDMGGIYTLGNQPGTVIRNNHFHHVQGLRYGGWGIYFDEGSTHVLAENNLVHHTTHGGFHQHYGRENTVRNNIFAFARDFQIQRSRAEEHSSFTFEGNIVYWDQGVLFSGSLANLNFSFDRNLYWRIGGGDIDLGGKPWKEWQAEGLDINSRIADPLFRDPAEDDFRLSDDSPALELGFSVFDAPGDS